MVDDEGLDWAAAAFELEAEAIHNVEGCGDHVVVLGVVGRQIEVVGAGDSRLVKDGKLEIATKTQREVIGGCVDAYSFAIDSGVPDHHNGAGIGCGVFGRFELERFAAARESVDPSCRPLEVELEAEAVGQETLEHEALFWSRFGVGNLDVDRG